jgi:predicted DNA-binding transcriptional regulator AlpA
MTFQPIHEPLAFRPVPSAPRYDVRQVADAVGLSVSRFRKVREQWTRDRDFPAEINEPGEPIRYLADAVDRWVERRTRRVHAAREAQAPPAPEANKTAREGRASLRKLKSRA